MQRPHSIFFFFFSSRRRHTRFDCDWSSDVCSSDLYSFYAEFRRAHGLMNLPHPEPPEIALQGHTTLVIPLGVRNRTGKTQEISLAASLPAGWATQSGTGKITGAAEQEEAARGGAVLAW